MYQKLQGIIIRRRRQELNWSQTTLCAGICAVSHLSKNGKAEGSPEVLRLYCNAWESNGEMILTSA